MVGIGDGIGSKPDGDFVGFSSSACGTDVNSSSSVSIGSSIFKLLSSFSIIKNLQIANTDAQRAIPQMKNPK